MPSTPENECIINEHRQMQKTISSRIAMLRFPLIVGVVFIHNYSTTAHLNPSGNGSVWYEFAHRVISEGIASIAVPLFYLMSGYLFFVGFDGFAAYREKLNRRVWTLLIPFLFWNLLTLAVYGFGESFKPTAPLFSSSVRFYVPGFHGFDYVNAMLGITGHPIAYQFWFIRDLMILVLLAPIIRLLFVRKLGLPLLLILFGCWYSGTWPILWPAAVSTLFFCVGSYLSHVDADLNVFDRYGKLLAPLYIVVLACDAAYFSRPGDAYIHKASMVVGLLTWWWMTGLIVRHSRMSVQRLSALGASSFFVFAAHEPELTILWKLALKKVHHLDGVVFLALYLLIPTVLITFLVFAHRILERAAPRFTALIAGERSQKKVAKELSGVAVYAK